MRDKTEVGNKKTKFKHRVIAMTLAVMMTASPVWGAAHAADEAIGNQTENTVAERYADNDKSEDHSNKADDYTESLQTDNRSADIEYEAPVAEIAEETAPAEDVQTAEVIPAAVTPEKVKKAEPAPAKGTQAAATAEEVQIAEAATAETAPAAMIADKEVPMAGVEETPYWALLNLIMTILTGIISAVLLVGYFGKKEDDEENDEESDDEKTNRKGFVRLMSLIPAVGAVIAFVLTENMNNPMIFTDRWTILMAAILLIQAVVAIFAKKSEDENEDDEIAEPVNA